nr:IS3 family transposase [Stigmatella erecta]
MCGLRWSHEMGNPSRRGTARSYESFFSSLKQELVYRTDFATRQQARLALFEYIEVFYNRQRRHSTLGYVSPVDFENAALPVTLAA